MKDSIAAFWRWWPTVEKEIAGSFSKNGLSEELVRDVSAHVAAISRELDWEFGPGRKAKHHLCVSANGDPALRIIAERWLHHAPKRTARWEFYPSRQAHATKGLVMRMDDKTVALDELRFVAKPDGSRERIDLVAHHPALAKSKKPKTNLQLVYIALDNLLGEDDVERFVGAVDVAKKKPAGKLISYAALGKLVAKVARKWSGEKWALLSGETAKGAPLVATVNRALKRIDHPLLDMHATITILLDAPNEQGLPTREESERLEAMENDLLDAFGHDAANLGHETLEGRRVVHLHVMEGGPAAQILATWRRRHRAARIEIEVERDPQWSALDRFDAP